MRFIALIKATKNSEAGLLPSKELLAAMGAFNEEMVRAGVMLAGEGLQPSSKGARVVFSGGKRSVIGGPFPETESLIAGFWMLEAASLDEAVAWLKRCPDPMGAGQAAEIELRAVFEASDFPADLFPPEEAAREQALRDELAAKAPGGS